ncbi:MAG TPA: aldo/keto reductase [Acidimicrobiales bacterium]|nr:aldo/keto reductase [Acidimicrobiales bacterium]
METRHLGERLEVTALGLGLMGMSGVYGEADDGESVATIRAALDAGVTLFDNAEAYGGGHSEELLGRALAGRRDEAVVTTKFGLTFHNGVMGEDGSPAHVRRSIETSLRRLQTDHVDLYFQHRVDLDTPIEDTVGAMAELVTEGKVRHIGLCEVSAATLRRAHAVHPVAAVQSEYSLWHRDPEDEVLPACEELGVGFMAYSPLGRGMLTGKVRRFEDLPPGDFRRVSPRFQGDNFQRNLDLVDHVTALAQEKGVEPAQLALAWVLARSPSAVAVFGTRHQANLRSNLGALDVSLTAGELARIDEIAPKGVAAGEAWPEAFMDQLNR